MVTGSFRLGGTMFERSEAFAWRMNDMVVLQEANLLLSFAEKKIHNPSLSHEEKEFLRHRQRTILMVIATIVSNFAEAGEVGDT